MSGKRNILKILWASMITWSSLILLLCRSSESDSSESESDTSSTDSESDSGSDVIKQAPKATDRREKQSGMISGQMHCTERHRL